MNLTSVMAGMTLRQMELADQLWREQPGADGVKLQDALTAGNWRAMGSMLAAKMRMNGHPDMTVDEAMDLELDAGEDPGEAPGGSDGVRPQLSPAPGA